MKLKAFITTTGLIVTLMANLAQAADTATTTTQDNSAEVAVTTATTSQNNDTTSVSVPDDNKEIVDCFYLEFSDNAFCKKH